MSNIIFCAPRQDGIAKPVEINHLSMAFQPKKHIQTTAVVSQCNPKPMAKEKQNSGDEVGTGAVT